MSGFDYGPFAKSDWAWLLAEARKHNPAAVVFTLLNWQGIDGNDFLIASSPSGSTAAQWQSGQKRAIYWGSGSAHEFIANARREKRLYPDHAEPEQESPPAFAPGMKVRMTRKPYDTDGLRVHVEFLYDVGDELILLNRAEAKQDSKADGAAWHAQGGLGGAIVRELHIEPLKPVPSAPAPALLIGVDPGIDAGTWGIVVTRDCKVVSAAMVRDQVKHCAECSSPATPGYDYCKYCQLQVLETPGLALKTDNHERNVAARARLSAYDKRSIPRRPKWQRENEREHPWSNAEEFEP